MRARALHITLCCLGVLIATACSVHQFPGEEPQPPKPQLQVELELSFATELPLHTVITYPDENTPSVVSRSAADAADYEMRHTVKIFSNEPGSRQTAFSRAEALYTFTFYTEPGYEENRIYHITLPDGEYSALVWSDHVTRADRGVAFYEPSDFMNIVFHPSYAYTGSSEWRDAFRGETDFTVSNDAATATDSVHNVVVPMVRPLGKLSIIATDVRRFVSRVAELAGPGTRFDPESFDFAGYSTRLAYTGYLPSTFNMHANKPVDSSLGVNFKSNIQPIDGDNAILAFDYVMVNGSESKVNAVVQILDDKNDVIAQSSPISIPLLRSKLTEVRGKFLTASASGGIGIDTDFDGNFNIYIP